MRKKRIPNPKKRNKTTPSRYSRSKWKKFWRFQEEEDKVSEEEVDEAEDKGPLAPTGAMDVANSGISGSSAQRPTRPHLEEEVDIEEEEVTAQCRT